MAPLSWAMVSSSAASALAVQPSEQAKSSTPVQRIARFENWVIFYLLVNENAAMVLLFVRRRSECCV
jgi:hypothetical protein